MNISIICHDFRPSNINRLPWKYIYEIASYLSQNHKITVITNSSDEDLVKEDFDIDLNVITVKKLFKPLKGETNELIDVLEREKPDKCVLLTGLTSFLRREFKIKQPTIGIFTSPTYPLMTLLKNIGIKDSLNYRRYTFIHYLNGLIPNYFVRKWGNSYEKMIFLSEYSEKKLIQKGFPDQKTHLIPCGIDDTFFHQPSSETVQTIRKKINPDNIPLIMYFTSPLTLRGTDTLLKAFARVLKTKNSRLVFLSRMDNKKLQDEVNKLEKIIKKEDIMEKVTIISEKLNIDEVKNYVSAADIICLPFKIIISDFPVSIIEAQLLGKTVISTDVAGIGEYVNESLLSKPNNHENLAETIIKELNLKQKSNEYSKENKSINTWENSFKDFDSILNSK